MQEFYSHGKLLLSAEYAVLDGAKALALPTKLGQKLKVKTTHSQKIEWKSYDFQNKLWFETSLTLSNLTYEKNNQTSWHLSQCFKAIKKLRPQVLESSGLEFSSYLEFPQNWGLGSSSTLVNNLAQWAKVDAYSLLAASFGGSGYDIGCAQYPHPIIYWQKQGKPHIEKAAFNPPFRDQLFFVHRNQKQNTREAIANYKALKKSKEFDFTALDKLTLALSKSDELENFETLIAKHELIIASLIKQTPLKNSHFEDYNGAIKSLGAWGGDFFMATGKDRGYFKNKGYNTILPFDQIILQ